MTSTPIIRAGVSLILAALITFGVTSGLTWEEWQIIGWAVILGGAGLALSSGAGASQLEAWAAGAPAATFLAGYTIFYWKLPIWQTVDIAAIASFLVVAYLNWKKRGGA
jgi:hypothetical protein